MRSDMDHTVLPAKLHHACLYSRAAEHHRPLAGGSPGVREAVRDTHADTLTHTHTHTSRQGLIRAVISIRDPAPHGRHVLGGIRHLSDQIRHFLAGSGISCMGSSSSTSWVGSTTSLNPHFTCSKTQSTNSVLPEYRLKLAGPSSIVWIVGRIFHLGMSLFSCRWRTPGWDQRHP